MSETQPVPIMSMVSSEVHPPEWDSPDATSGSFNLVPDGAAPTGSFVLTEEAPIVGDSNGSFVLKEDVPIVDTEESDGSFVLKESVPIVDTEESDGSFVLKEDVPIVDTEESDGSFVLKESVPIVDNGPFELPPFVEQAIASVVPEEGFTPGHFVVSIDRAAECEGLIGEIHKAVVTEGERELTILCKIPPLDPVRRQQFNSNILFEREINVYSNVLPTMFEFQRQKGVTEELNSGFFNVPKCYLARFDPDNEEALILMEDLRVRELAMWNKLEPINYEHARLVMIQLGRFHALSFAMKDQRPDLFEACKIPDAMVPAMQHNDQLMGMFGVALDAAMNVLDPEDERTRWKMQGLRNDYFAVLESCVDVERVEPYAVLNHGDCWINNLMFGYQDGAAQSVTFIDWQLARYGSPALDVLYFLFCCSDEAFRDRHYDEMLRIYYTALKDLLEQLGSEAMDVFPFTALLRQLKSTGKFAVIMGALDIPILCTDPADVHSHGDAASAFAASGEAQQRYGQRMGGVIRDAIKYGYL
ncbi:hypothetical protein pipiens_008207 [Culex pipiens pipiens]|uniref:CHK kinase-like domain-containing protein n=1 Tax=Culex pipiens pipiens TaxID=38569 RepID=A0ABD1DIH4_CULPP